MSRSIPTEDYMLPHREPTTCKIKKVAFSQKHKPKSTKAHWIKHVILD